MQARLIFMHANVTDALANASIFFSRWRIFLGADGIRNPPQTRHRPARGSPQTRQATATDPPQTCQGIATDPPGYRHRPATGPPRQKWPKRVYTPLHQWCGLAASRTGVSRLPIGPRSTAAIRAGSRDRRRISPRNARTRFHDPRPVPSRPANVHGSPCRPVQTQSGKGTPPNRFLACTGFLRGPAAMPDQGGAPGRLGRLCQPRHRTAARAGDDEELDWHDGPPTP